MKRITVLMIITGVILCAAACSQQSSVTVTTLPSASASPMQTAAAQVSDTASPSESAELLASVSASPSPTPEPKPVYKGPTIIATYDGEIRGGYADGQWLTSGGAAALCKGKMTFGEYNLVDLKKKVKSSGVTHEKGEHASETSDGKGCYYLKTPKIDVKDNYSKDPLCFSYLYYGGKLPDIKRVKATSAIKGAVQKLLDKNMGKGKAKARVRIAVSADIEGDGQKETVVNADYVSGYNDGPDEGKPIYCLSCIIESDGAVKIIDAYYFVPTKKEPELNGVGFFYVQNIIDLDGDNISELIVNWEYGEEYGMTVYKYSGSSVEEIMDYDVIYDIS